MRKGAGSMWRAAAVQSLLLAAAAWLAVLLRSAAMADSLGDSATVAMTVGGLLAIASAAALAFRIGLRAPIARRARCLLMAAPAMLLVLCGTVARSVYPETSVEMEAIADPDTDGSGTVLELGANGADVRLSGDIVDGAAARLEALLRTHPQVTRIHLTSDGGLADEGEALGDVVARHGLATYVPDYCVSACTLVFVRGRERFVARGGRVGFHGPYEQGLFGRTFSDDPSEVKAAYIEAGLQPTFVDQALKVRPEDIWIPSEDRLLSARVATAIVGRDRFPDSSLDGSATLAGSRQELLTDFPVLAGFAEQAPGAVDKIAAWYLSAYRRGRSEAANVEGLRAMIGSAVATAVARADAPTDLRIARLLARALDQAYKPEACFAIGEHADLLAAGRVLAARSARGDGPAGAEIADLVARSIRANDRTMPIALVGVVPHAADAGECAAMRASYAALLARPPEEAAREMHALLASRATTSLAALKLVNAR